MTESKKITYTDATTRNNADWTVTPDVISAVRCYTEHVELSAIAKNIDEALCSKRKFTVAQICDWLTEKGYLARMKATEKGRALGIVTDEVPDEKGEIRHCVWCGLNAQAFIKVHLDEIVSLANNGKITERETHKIPFTITQSELSLFEFSKTPLLISEITERIRALSSVGVTLKNDDITNWLMAMEFIKVINMKGEDYVMLTDSGSEIGIRYELKDGKNGGYSLVYGMTAQKFIVDNFHLIADVD